MDMNARMKQFHIPNSTITGPSPVNTSTEVGMHSELQLRLHKLQLVSCAAARLERGAAVPPEMLVIALTSLTSVRKVVATP